MLSLPKYLARFVKRLRLVKHARCFGYAQHDVLNYQTFLFLLTSFKFQ